MLRTSFPSRGVGGDHGRNTRRTVVWMDCGVSAVFVVHGARRTIRQLVHGVAFVHGRVPTVCVFIHAPPTVLMELTNTVMGPNFDPA